MSLKKRVGRIVLAFFLLSTLLLGCSDEKTATQPNDTESESEDASDAGMDAGSVDTETESEQESVCGPVDPETATADSQLLFDYDHVPTFDIYLPPETWELLQENARDEEYTEATACFEGRSIGTVGLRFKGAYGSLISCFDENDVNICRKLGMKLKFDKYDDDNRFFGLKRLNFQGNRYDGSYLKEKLAYELYRSMGVISPRAAWANVRVNGEMLGLFGMVEQIDGRFTANRWPDNGDGNLFKETWPIRTDEEWLIDRLKTNEDAADVSDFVAFSQAMLDADLDAVRDALGVYSDLDHWARYMAVDDAIANFDGITAYYTSEDAAWAGNHNFYIYEEAADHFTIIPWDLESTFALGSFGNVPHWTQLPEDCDLTYYAWGDPNSLVIAPGCDRVFRAIAADTTAYQEAGETLLSGPFETETMNAVIDEYAAFIRDAAEADPNGPGLAVFEGAVGTLKGQIPKLRDRLSYLLAGETWVPFEIPVDAVTDLEAQDELGLFMGPQIYNNGNTEVSITVNTDTPIHGERDLMIAFEFDDEENPWEQWLNYIVPLKNGAQDVTSLQGIRLRVRADSARQLRLELDHLYTSSANNWIREGWYIAATQEATQVEVLLADAEVPPWAADQGLHPLADIEDVLTGIKGLLFAPQCNGRDAAGYLPNDTTDPGFIEIDDIEFF